jgi:predicted O-methyltransferase YrrM
MTGVDNLIETIEAHKIARGGAHRAGTLMREPLYAIKDYLEHHFGGRQIRTVETGCGASTIVFARYSQSHHAYCYDDRTEDNSSVEFTMSFSHFDAAKVEWHFGPTQCTLRDKPLKEPVDMALIDGPHGYPFPEFEYMMLYPLIKPGGILVIDDIHIPTIRHLFNFLREDDMFRLDRVVSMTAFFQRSEAALFDPEGDGWWLQLYNMRRFPAYPDGATPKWPP